jgi:hypothetical protein
MCVVSLKLALKVLAELAGSSNCVSASLVAHANGHCVCSPAADCPNRFTGWIRESMWVIRHIGVSADLFDFACWALMKSKWIAL